MPSTGARPLLAADPALPRRRVLAGLVGVPIGLAIAACTRVPARPRPSGSAAPTDPATVPPTTPAPPPDAPALAATALATLALVDLYAATVAAHASLGPALAPYAADHEVHLAALAERIALPTEPPPTSSITPRATTDSTDGTTGPAPTAPSVPATPEAARAAVVHTEQIAADEASAAAFQARDGEAARLLASIGASRSVHALLLPGPA